MLSFTGEGVIALFDHTHYFTESKAAAEALHAAEKIRDRIFELVKTAPASADIRGITLRAGLHFGKVFVPSSGHLRQQAIGRDVVITTRLCDWISKTIEPAV